MTKTKVCTTCRRELPLENFSKEKKNKDGHAIYCRECRAKKYQEKKELYQESGREYYYKNRDSVLLRDKLRRRALRKSALKTLRDPPECFSCGIQDIRVLDIDHLNDKGADERKEVSYTMIWRKISNMTRENALKEYQILCRNCNWIKFIEKTNEES